MHKILLDLGWFPLGAISIAICLLGICLVCSQLVDEYKGYIRAAWYFYFLLAIVTFLAGMICVKFNIIDASGQFHGDVGAVLNKLFIFLFGLNEDMEGAAGIVLLILGPQIGSYMFSGVLSGCAAMPRHTGAVMKYVFMSLAKSFVLAAGVLLGLGILGYADELPGMDGQKAFYIGIFSLYFQFLGFHFMSTFCSIKNIEKKGPESRLPSWLQWLHKKMTRNVKDNLATKESVTS